MIPYMIGLRHPCGDRSTPLDSHKRDRSVINTVLSYILKCIQMDGDFVVSYQQVYVWIRDVALKQQ